MATNIYKSDGTPIELVDGVVDQRYNNQSGNGVGLQLVGRAAANYVAPLAQDFLQLVENYCSSTVPLDSTTLQGQLWFEKVSATSGNLYVRTSGAITGGILNWKKIPLGESPVLPGSYTNANITVDQFGRVTSASNGSSGGGGGGSGTVTGVGVTGNNGITVSGSPITTNGVFILGLGTITPNTVEASGTITASNFTGTSSGTNTGDQTIRLTGDVTGNGTGTFTTTLTNTGVTPGTYTVASIIVDAKGRILSASSGSTGGGGTVTSVAVAGNSGIVVSGSPITSSGIINLSLGAITPTAVASTGIISGSNFTGSSSGSNTGDQIITLTGDVTGAGSGSFVTTLSNSGVAAGSYTAANITVDAKGRITQVSSSSTATFTTVTTTSLNVQNLTFTGTGPVVINSGNDINLTAPGRINLGALTTLPSMFKANLPLGVPVGTLAYCTDATGGAGPVYFNGTAWFKMTGTAV